MAEPMNDARFFAMVGIGVPAANKIEIFKELVSLFDSLHDFGSFGSVYDYITQTEGEFITVRKTIFNHLRNGYSRLNGLYIISKTNSQLHSYSNNFHLKASLTKANLENAFYNYAKDVLYTGPRNEVSSADLRYGMLTATFGPSIIFSVDTQKKLFSSPALTESRTYQVFDREKQCDPASHTKESAAGDRVILLKENITAGSLRRYVVPGVTEARVTGNTANMTKLFIDLPGSVDGTGVLINSLGSAHPNNVTNVNNQLKALILRGSTEDMPSNVNLAPDLNFYDADGIKGYGTGTNNNKKYILDVRRKLAQKRLGDQLQVLGCMQPINYSGGITVVNPIFVSIDRMAIAFAIANGVNCIYSNADRLTLFKGANETAVTGTLPQSGGEVLEASKKNQMGGFREPWDTVQDRIRMLIRREPEYLLSYFTYSGALPDGQTQTRNTFNEFLTSVMYTSIDTYSNGVLETGAPDNHIYHIRSFTDSRTGRKMHGTDDTSSLVFLQNGEDSWSIVDNGRDIILANNTTRVTLSIRHDTFDGFFRGNLEERYDQEGGGKNKDFIKSMALYDILTLFDTEQMKIWYDEFYVNENGKAFHSPTFYELNAFFQVLFEEDIDYMLIFPFLKNNSDPFSKAVLYAIERILDYMDISVPYDTKIDASSEAVLSNVLEQATEKSKEYGHSISTLNGSKLLDYLFEHNLTPMYFYNVFSKRFPVKIDDHSTKVVSTHGVSRKRRYNTHIPFERRVLIKAVGGKKKYKGSPRRKTLRKTRRHR